MVGGGAVETLPNPKRLKVGIVAEGQPANKDCPEIRHACFISGDGYIYDYVEAELNWVEDLHKVEELALAEADLILAEGIDRKRLLHSYLILAEGSSYEAHFSKLEKNASSDTKERAKRAIKDFVKASTEMQASNDLLQYISNLEQKQAQQLANSKQRGQLIEGMREHPIAAVAAACAALPVALVYGCYVAPVRGAIGAFQAMKEVKKERIVGRLESLL
jgi:hypothetical protein